MNRRKATLSTAALSALIVAITHVGCNSPTFTGDDPGAGDAGTAGASGASNPPSASAGANGEGGSENGGNDAGSANGGAANGGSADAGAPSDGGASGHDGNNGVAGNTTGGSENTGGANDAGHAGVSGTECDPRWFPADATCVIDERYGVFVSPQGSDATGNGSRAAPYGSIARAVAAALANDRRVYACADEGVYAERVSIDVAEGLELFGGFSCADWSYDTTLKSAVVSGSARALRVSAVSGLRFEDFRFEAADAKTAGESSIAAWVADSSDVMFVRSVLQAGRGAGGTHGGLSTFSGPAPSAMAGNAATGGPNGSPGAAKRCECQTAELTSTGGAGGPPGHQTGTMGLPDYGAGRPGQNKELGCKAKSGARVGNGEDGRDAPATPPAPGAMTLGVADRNGWHPTAGEDGMPGAPGQGGGGGASHTFPEDSRGGGGGCGSCGGNGGQGGRGGGASIALLVLDASVALANSELIAADGGNGGHGSVGQEGQPITGEGGAGFEGCRGGNGGKGARGGAGGGGAGGVSVGILWNGSDAPVRLETEIRTGAPGVRGAGGGGENNHGIDGVSQAVLELT